MKRVHAPGSHLITSPNGIATSRDFVEQKGHCFPGRLDAEVYRSDKIRLHVSQNGFKTRERVYLVRASVLFFRRRHRVFSGCRYGFRFRWLVLHLAAPGVSPLQVPWKGDKVRGCLKEGRSEIFASYGGRVICETIDIASLGFLRKRRCDTKAVWQKLRNRQMVQLFIKIIPRQYLFRFPKKVKRADKKTARVGLRNLEISKSQNLLN